MGACLSCGATLPFDARFCTSCGQAVRRDAGESHSPPRAVGGQAHAAMLSEVESIFAAAVRSEERANYTTAARLYATAGDKSEQLLHVTVVDPKNRMGRTAGIAASLLTGGFGWEDLIIGPVVARLVGRFVTNRALKVAQLLWVSMVRELEVSTRCPDTFGEASTEAHFLRRFFFLYTEVNPANPTRDALFHGIGTRIFQRDLHFPELNELLAQYADRYMWLPLVEALQQLGYLRARTEGSSGKSSSRRSGNRNSMSMAEARQVLGVDADATLAEIKRAFHAKVAQWHPDKLADLAQELRDMATEQMKLLNEAYEILSDYAARSTS